jgi:Histidine kinase-, DNA gyrase B-, and HSP90-like ATPase
MLDFNRTMFETPMVEEFFTEKGLTAQTGQSRDNFGSVVLKELVDNSLDASEYAGVSPIIGINVKSGLGLHIISVSDNGNGISGDTISRILNFQTRTSDKAAYRTPARGAQGNALKTLIGMPYALGISEPVVIQSMGTKHSIKAWLDPSGKLRIDHQKTDSSVVSGTVVSVTIPYSVNVNSVKWARGFSLFNPHASFLVKIEEIEHENDHAHSEIIFDEIYRNTADNKWKKFSTKDTASAFWYDLSAFKRLVYCHISDAQTGGTDILLREFVMQFRGISSTIKAKAVCSHFTQRRLSEFDKNDAGIARLLDVLKKSSQQPKSSILGIIGGDHFRDRFRELYGVKKFYYKKRLFIDAGIPYVMELAIAKTDPEYGCHAFYGINFSHSFGDPVQKYLRCGDKGMQIYSLAQLQNELGDDDISIAFHLVSPALNFKDRGKTALSLTEPVIKELQELIWECSRELYLEKKRRDRNERAALKADENSLKEATISFKEAVFDVLIEAHSRATSGGLPSNVRNLFYQVRPLIQPFTDKELDYGYFSQNLYPEYERINGKMPLIYRDPRGVLYEPHTGNAVYLGTREVDSYEFPSWLYDKILYIEKKGFGPVIEAARLAEKYDMAVICGEGYACEAARVLFSNADKNQSYKLFVLHDCDPHGYNICRTLAEETARMPGYHVEIHDMGLSLSYAVSVGLLTETFIRKKALPTKITLTDAEKILFTGKEISRNTGKAKLFKAERIELNALSSKQLVEYIESKLIEFGVTEKVIPDADSLPGMADAITKQMVHEMVERIISETFSIPKIASDIHSKWGWDASGIKDRIEAKFNSDRSQSWRDAVHKSFREHLNEYAGNIRKEVEQTIKGE